jgi:hypothetical protein
MKLLKLVLAGQMILGGMGPLVYAENKSMVIVAKVEKLFGSECNNGAADWLKTNNLKFTDCLQQVTGKLTDQDKSELEKAMPILRSKYSTKQMQELDHFIAQADQNNLMFSDVSEFMANQNKTAISGQAVLGIVMLSLAIGGLVRDAIKNAKYGHLRSADEIRMEYWAKHANDKPETETNTENSGDSNFDIEDTIKLEESRTERIRDCENVRNKSLNKNAKGYLEQVLTNAKICVMEVRGEVSP